MVNNEDRKFMNKSYLVVVATSVVGFFSGFSSKFFKGDSNLDKDSQFYNSPIGSGISDSALNKMEENYYNQYEQSKQNDTAAPTNNKPKKSDEKTPSAMLPLVKKEDFEIGGGTNKKLAHPQEEPDKKTRFTDLVSQQNKQEKDIKHKNTEKITPGDSFYKRIKRIPKDTYKYNLK